MYFGWTIYIIEGALLTFGAFLAWESRHVSYLISLLSYGWYFFFVEVMAEPKTYHVFFL